MVLKTRLGATSLVAAMVMAVISGATAQVGAPSPPPMPATSRPGNSSSPSPRPPTPDPSPPPMPATSRSGNSSSPSPRPPTPDPSPPPMPATNQSGVPSSPSPRLPTSGVPMATTSPAPCPVGFHGSTCSLACDCSGHACNQWTAACQCPRCFTGASCNVTAADGGGRKCVQDFFTARTPEQVSVLRTEIGRLPPLLQENDVEAIMSDYASTSVNRIRSPRYNIISKPGGGKLVQISCILLDSQVLDTFYSKVKRGEIGATAIVNSVTNHVVLNKPSF